MRYFQFLTWSYKEGDKLEVMSEDDIRNEYFPWWYEKMCEKHGKEHVDQTYSFRECLEDWIIMHYATEIEEGEN